MTMICSILFFFNYSVFPGTDCGIDSRNSRTSWFVLIPVTLSADHECRPSFTSRNQT